MSNKLVNRVLLINDDGIHAPGMALLKSIAIELANEVWIVAPAIDQSGVSCAVSLKAPFRVAKYEQREYAVYGTPADCASFAIKHLMKDCLPDLVLSGINNGSNLGFETILSGTVGGVMMSMVLGIKSIALSQVVEESCQLTNWDASAHYTKTVVEKLLLSPHWSNDICFNVNFPNCDHQEVQGIKMTTQGDVDVEGLAIIPAKDPENNDYYWFRATHSKVYGQPERELDACNLNYVSVTPLSYDRTAVTSYNNLKDLFS